MGPESQQQARDQAAEVRGVVDQEQEPGVPDPPRGGAGRVAREPDGLAMSSRNATAMPLRACPVLRCRLQYPMPVIGIVGACLSCV